MLIIYQLLTIQTQRWGYSIRPKSEAYMLGDLAFKTFEIVLFTASALCMVAAVTVAVAAVAG
jgi:hypothetical protein